MLKKFAYLNLCWIFTEPVESCSCNKWKYRTTKYTELSGIQSWAILKELFGVTWPTHSKCHQPKNDVINGYFRENFSFSNFRHFLFIFNVFLSNQWNKISNYPPGKLSNKTSFKDRP